MGHRQPSQESLTRRNVSQEMIPRVLSAENGQPLSRQGSHGSFSAARMGASPSHEVQPSLRRGGEFPAYADGFSSRQDDRSWSSSSAQSSRGSYPQSEYVVRRSSSGSYLNTGAPEFVVGEDQNRKHDSAEKQLRGNAANGGGHSAEDSEEEGLSMLTSALLNMLDTTDHDASGRDKRGDPRLRALGSLLRTAQAPTKEYDLTRTYRPCLRIKKSPSLRCTSPAPKATRTVAPLRPELA